MNSALHIYLPEVWLSLKPRKRQDEGMGLVKGKGASSAGFEGCPQVSSSRYSRVAV